MRNVHKILALTAMLSLGATGALAEGSSNTSQSTTTQSGSPTEGTVQNRDSGTMDGNGMSPQSNMSPNTNNSNDMSSSSSDVSSSPSTADSSSAASASTQLSASDLRNVQERLSDNGYSVSVDGVWGPQTASAIRDFQSANDLSVTGRLDSQTISALELNRSDADSQTN